MSTKMEVNTVSELLLPLEVPEMAIRKSFKHRIFFFKCVNDAQSVPHRLLEAENCLCAPTDLFSRSRRL